MLRERIVPAYEVIRPMILEDSPCCGVSHLVADILRVLVLLVRVDRGEVGVYARPQPRQRTAGKGRRKQREPPPGNAAAKGLRTNTAVAPLPFTAAILIENAALGL